MANKGNTDIDDNAYFWAWGFLKLGSVDKCELHYFAEKRLIWKTQPLFASKNTYLFLLLEIDEICCFLLVFSVELSEDSTTVPYPEHRISLLLRCSSWMIFMTCDYDKIIEIVDQRFSLSQEK